MTEDKTTITDNEVIALIAEFMGLDVDGQNVSDGQQETTIDRLKYPTSWDWLMPVWYKFRDLEGFQFDDDHTACCEKISDEITFGGPSPSEACKLLAEGIRWYNSTQNKEQS